MKISVIRKKIIVNFSTSAILVLTLGISIAYFGNDKDILTGDLEKTKSDTSQIINQSSELQSKVIEIRRYKELWGKITESKKNTDGIKIDDINLKLKTIAEKYIITNQNIRVTLPEILTAPPFNSSTVNILFTTVNLAFDSVNDVKALLFINEFISSLAGYPVLTNLEIKKTKTYTNEDLVNISSGKGGASITVKVDFSWYVYKNKEGSATAPSTATPDIK